MVRIHRNDASPRQTVNLVSDEEQQPSNSSPASTDSSNSPTSSHSSSSLSDFIEEDHAPVPTLGSSSSWDRVKPRRKPLRTLRRKPRLDKIDADDEHSTSTASTSSEGIPRPEVELDADDEEGQIETTPTRRPPKTRKRPRRAAAPPCFLDALNKFVEPMSKEAKQYQGLTLSQILYGESDDQGHSDHSDDSSVQYVPCTPANHVPRANCDTAESEVSREHAVDPENNYHHAHTLGSTLKRRRPRKRTRTSHSPPARVSSPTQESGPILLTAEHRNTREYTERPRASIRPSKRRRCRQRNSSPGSGSPNVEEQEAHSNELESERNELRELNDHQPIQRHRQNSNQHTPEDGNFEAEEVIDLCSADECEANMFENRTQPSTATNCKQKGSLISEHAPQERVSDIGMTDLRKPEERFEYNANDKSCSKRDDISTLRAAEPYSFPQNECFRPCTNESSTGHDEGVDLDRMEERKKRESPPSPQARIVEEGSKPSANDLTIWNSERQIKSQAQICGEEAGCDPIEERNRKQEIDVKAVENRESSDLVSKPEPVQTHSISPPNLGDDTKPDNPKIVRLRPRRRFKGAKARGTNKPHPDVFRKRVPQSQEEIQAWLAFAKAEARDIHQALTGNVSTERYKCANTDMVFIRQILGELGKLMGLKVHSEKDGTGRRIILERSSHGCVRGSLEEVEQAVEGFFYDALTDLTGQSRTTKQEFRRVPEMKDAIEPSKTSSGLIDGDQVMGEDRNALPRTISPKAPRNCNRRQQRKGKPSPRVARTAPKRKTRSNYRN